MCTLNGTSIFKLKKFKNPFWDLKCRKSYNDSWFPEDHFCSEAHQEGSLKRIHLMEDLHVSFDPDQIETISVLRGDET